MYMAPSYSLWTTDTLQDEKTSWVKLVRAPEVSKEKQPEQHGQRQQGHSQEEVVLAAA